jgi:hypothetical protein
LNKLISELNLLIVVWLKRRAYFCYCMPQLSQKTTLTSKEVKIDLNIIILFCPKET